MYSRMQRRTTSDIRAQSSRVWTVFFFRYQLPRASNKQGSSRTSFIYYAEQNRHISAAVQPILTQFGTMMHFEPLDRPDRQKFKILQIQLRYLGNGLNNLMTFQYSLNISKQYMYITTSAE